MYKLNIFYEEPNPDRWIKYDRYPRKFLRRIIRGPEPIGGVKRWFLNLIQGLDKLGYTYDINNYNSIKKDSLQWALVIGKSHVIQQIPTDIKIIYGPGISSHPLDNDFWLKKPNIKHILIPCEWFKRMYDRDLPVNIPTTVWPSGVETDLWIPTPNKVFKNSILIYDKIRWNHEEYERELIRPIYSILNKVAINIHYIKYGSYKENHFKELLKQVDGMIFLCEHETQGFAYLQTLSCDVPILAWDRGGFWEDPSLYPQKVKFAPVTSVPYWNETCGEKFRTIDEFEPTFNIYWEKVLQQSYAPRKYILANFQLEARAKSYIEIVEKIIKNHARSQY